MAYRTRPKMKPIIPLIRESETILGQKENYDRRKTKTNNIIEVGYGKDLVTTIQLAVATSHDAGIWAGLSTGYKHVHCKAIKHNGVLFTGARSGLLYGLNML
eukprot:gnl/Chilomastix_caulleri/3366.p1 GENE.gnl/Chilomastix_caulleri/3366~~gnl/Chilomastix_caulleri/3366.p1  ORF type:complete len:102 (+),score=23.51 gnl/Chilomastix_caulleri/3366:157-462(+)